MEIKDLFQSKNKPGMINKKVDFHRNAISQFMKNSVNSKKQRKSTILLYRLLFNADEKLIDFLLDDNNFDDKHRLIKD